MDTINGIPLRWDAVQDNSLLGELLSNTATQVGNIQGIATSSGSSSLFEDSPFGEGWDKLLIVPDSGEIESWLGQDPQPQKPIEQQITYHTFYSTNGVGLINAYQKDTLYRRLGSFIDKERDISIYYEDETKDNELGAICFVRFNATTKNYFIKNKGAAGLFANQVVEQQANGNGAIEGNVKLDAGRISEAIAFELEYGGAGVEIFRKIAQKLLHKVAEKIRKTKYTEKNWDFDRADYDPLIGSEILRKVVRKWEEFKEDAVSFIRDCYKTAAWCREYIPYIGDFVAWVIEGVTDFVTNIVDKVDRFFKFLDDINKTIAVVNAFICGVINELLEVAAGLLDLLALFVMLSDKVERKLLEESLENMIGAIKKDPEKILERLQKAWNDTKDRYSDDKSRYEKAYNAGEDIVDAILFVELIVGVVKFIKNIPELLKNLRKWALEKGEKIRRLKTPSFKSTEELVVILKENKNFKVILDELKSGKVARAFEKLLSLEEEAVLRYYTTNSGYKNFNKALRGEIEMTEMFMAQEQLMNQALEKLPISSFNTPEKLLYRIENLTDKQIESIYKVGETFLRKDFTSATYSAESIATAIENRPYTVLIRIEGKSGKLIEDLSTLKQEHEILFKSRTEFLVKSIGLSDNPAEFGDAIKTIILIEK